MIKKAIQVLVFVPNLPVIFIISAYTLYKIIKHSSWVEIEFMRDEDLLNADIKQYLDDIYPNYAKYVIAIIFYLWLFLFLFKN